MKSVQYIIIAIIFMCHGYAAVADNIVTVYADDITIPSLSNKSIDIDIPIMIESNVDITSFQCDLYLPQNVSFSIANKGALIGQSHNFNWNQKNGYTRFMCYSPTKETLSNRNGELFVVRVRASASIAIGSHTIYLKNIYFSDAGKPAGGYEVEDKEVRVIVEKKILVESLSVESVNIRRGESYQLRVTIAPDNAENKILKWESSNTAVATVDSEGTVTGVAEGQATITAKTTDYSGVTASCYVTVNDYISFSDPTVESLCLNKWDKNKDGNLSLSEAKAVTDIGTTFRSKAITSFEEFRYFTGVKTLKAYAFENCSNLQSITLPSTLTSIGNSAFYYCSNLQSIVLPSSLTSIGDYAFYKCSMLSSIAIPASVTSIGEGAFNRCVGLKEIVVDDDNPVFDSRDDCNALIRTNSNLLISGCENTVIPNTVVTIGQYAFSYLTGLSSLLIPNSVETIESYAFQGCSMLQTIVVEEGNPIFDSRNNCNAVIITATNTLLLGCKNTVIPNTCEAISSLAFWSCVELIQIDIPESVQSIGASAFRDCVKLTQIDIPESVQAIGAAAFFGCESLTHVSLPETLTSIGVNAFRDCSNLQSISIPDPVTLIAENTFSGCTSLQDVKIGSSVSSINKTAFTNCNVLNLEINSQSIAGATYTSVLNLGTYFGGNVENLVLGANVTSIGNYAFYGLKNLESVEFSQQLASIGKASFKGCSALQNLTLPESLNSIGSEAFYQCSALKDVYTSRESPFQLTEDVFENVYSSGYSRNLYVPYGCLGVYKKATNWSKFAQIIAGDENEDYGMWDAIGWRYNKHDHILTLSGEGALPTSISATNCSWSYYQSDIEKIEIEEGITDIGKVLASVHVSHIELPSTITRIGSEAFKNNGTLETIGLPDGLSAIGEYAFKGCSKLKSIVIPNSVKSIGSWAFGECLLLDNIILPEPITTIENNTFWGCNRLKSISIPNSVKSIGAEAFSRCEDMESVTFSNSLTTISSNAFSLCASLKSVELPSGVTSIGSSAFSGCTDLLRVSWENSLNTIGDYAFRDCVSLRQVISNKEYPVSLSKYSYVFYGCSDMTLLVPYGCRTNYLYSSYSDIFEDIEEIEPENYLFIPNTEVSGNKIILPIVMKNSEVIKGLQFDLRLPDGFSVATNNVGDGYMFGLTSRASKSHSVASNLLKTGDYRVVVSSLQGAIFAGNNGVVMNVTLQLDNSVSDGEYDVYISSIILNTSDNIPIESRGNTSKLIVSKSTKGDVNGDGKINVTDVGMVIDHILEHTPNGFIAEAADINGDGDINVTDVGLVIDIILSDNSAREVLMTENVKKSVEEIHEPQ